MIAGSGVSSVLSSSYLSEDSDILSAEAAIMEQEDTPPSSITMIDPKPNATKTPLL